MASAEERPKSSPEQRLDKAGAEFKRLEAEIKELRKKNVKLEQRVESLEIIIPIRKIKYYKREPPKVGEPIPEEVKAEFDRIKKLHEYKQKKWNDFGTEKI